MKKSSLASILAARDRDPWQRRVKLLSALSKWVHEQPGRRGVPYEELPESAKMIVTLDEMHKAINSAGILYVLDWNIGERFHEAQAWLTKLRARRTVAYFAAAAAFYPRKRVPHDSLMRSKVSGALLERDDEPLQALDDIYREEVLAEIPDTLRTYLKANIATVEQELSSATRKDATSSPDDVLEMSDVIAKWADSHRRVLAGEMERGSPEVVAIGDVIEVKIKSRRMYLQAALEHPYWTSHGPIVRVLPGVFKTALRGDRLKRLVAGRAAYVVNWNADYYIAEHAATIVGHFSVPAHARAFPIFLYHQGRTRDGRHVWGLWQGAKTTAGQVIGPLTAAQSKWPVLNRILLPADIVRGWSPEKEILSWGEKTG